MREIKFRAWDKGEKYYKTWEDLVSIVYNERWFLDNEDKNYINCLFTDPDYTLEQYTGLKDKNGKEIYDGDVCRCLVYDKYHKKHLVRGDIKIEEVETVINNIYDDSWPCVSLACVELHSIEIIGNIHQNPELLERKE